MPGSNHPTHSTSPRYPAPAFRTSPAPPGALLPLIHTDNLAQSFATPPPPGKLYLLYGDPLVFPLSMNIASYVLSKGMRLAVADGCNQFNPHAIIRFAQQRRLNADNLLKRIFVSRSFTCYQMEQTITNLLPSFLPTIDSTTAVVLGILDTLYDEQAPLREVRQILRRMLEILQKMKENGISILITAQERTVHPPERNALFAALKSGMDTIYRLNDSFELHLEKGAMHHGKNRTDLHEHHRQRSCQLGQVSSGTSEGGTGDLR
ncbi:MAG TPA: hypothetical protein VNN76_11960 [Bacteroidota bacterium]|nr:hypothetical protein [Bacteroidota bacterium]